MIYINKSAKHNTIHIAIEKSIDNPTLKRYYKQRTYKVTCMKKIKGKK